MAEFLDSLFEKVAPTAEKVMQKSEDLMKKVSVKTGEVVEEQKVKYEIHTLKKEIEGKQKEIGKLTYIQYRKGGEKDARIVDLCREIQELELKIKDLRAKGDV